MNILTWHVHGSWTTAFVQGQHTYLIPVLPDRGPDGRGRAETYAWPDAVMEVPPQALSSMDVDVVVLQRPHEWQLAESWLGRRLGRDVPVIYVEHNTPREDVVDSRHPMADRDDVTLIHVTHFNDLFWDAGGTRTAVIEHGIVEPAAHFDGRLPHLAAVINEPVRRARITGTDLLPRFTEIAPIDLFGMGVHPLEGPGVRTYENPPQAEMHSALAQRRVYLHTTRWTSLGLSLLEAMTIGLPVVALGTTEAAEAVPPGAGVVSTRVETLTEAARWLISDVDAAREMGRRARAAALHRYGLHRFLSEWEYVLKEVAAP
jgi:glycosyltransferase involved in cell wall biosynthesis